MSSEDIEKLYDCIINKPLRYRKRAIGVLSVCKGISQHCIHHHPHMGLIEQLGDKRISAK